jgi:hypothetical protein
MLVPDQASTATGEKLGHNWGKNLIFTQESPQKSPQNPSEQQWGRVGVCDSAPAICHTTRTPQVHPQKFLFKLTPIPIPICEKKIWVQKKIHRHLLYAYLYYQPNSCNSHAEHECAGGTFLDRGKKFLQPTRSGCRDTLP